MVLVPKFVEVRGMMVFRFRFHLGPPAPRMPLLVHLPLKLLDLNVGGSDLWDFYTHLMSSVSRAPVHEDGSWE